MILNSYYSFIILYKYYYFILTCVNLLNMFIKHDFKLEMFVAVCWSYGKCCVFIVRSSIPLVDHSVVKVYILILLYKSTPSFTVTFFF